MVAADLELKEEKIMTKLKIRLTKLSVGISLNHLETNQPYFIVPSDTPINSIALALDCYFLGIADANGDRHTSCADEIQFFNESGEKL